MLVASSFAALLYLKPPRPARKSALVGGAFSNARHQKSHLARMRYALSPPNRLVWLVVGGVGLRASCLRGGGRGRGEAGANATDMLRAHVERTSFSSTVRARLCDIFVSRHLWATIDERNKKAPDGINTGNSDEARCMCATQNGNADARGKYKATNALRRLRACACSRAPLLMEEIKATHAHRFPRIPALVGAASSKCARGVAIPMMPLHVAIV